MIGIGCSDVSLKFICISSPVLVYFFFSLLFAADDTLLFFASQFIQLLSRPAPVNEQLKVANCNDSTRHERFFFADAHSRQTQKKGGGKATPNFPRHFSSALDCIFSFPRSHTTPPFLPSSSLLSGKFFENFFATFPSEVLYFDGIAMWKSGETTPRSTDEIEIYSLIHALTEISHVNI